MGDRSGDYRSRCGGRCERLIACVLRTCRRLRRRVDSYSPGFGLGVIAPRSLGADRLALSSSDHVCVGSHLADIRARFDDKDASDIPESAVAQWDCHRLGMNRLDLAGKLLGLWRLWRFHRPSGFPAEEREDFGQCGVHRVEALAVLSKRGLDVCQVVIDASHIFIEGFGRWCWWYCHTAHPTGEIPRRIRYFS